MIRPTPLALLLLICTPVNPLRADVPTVTFQRLPHRGVQPQAAAGPDGVDGDVRVVEDAAACDGSEFARELRE